MKYNTSVFHLHETTASIWAHSELYGNVKLTTPIAVQTYAEIILSDFQQELIKACFLKDVYTGWEMFMHIIALYFAALFAHISIDAMQWLRRAWGQSRMKSFGEKYPNFSDKYLTYGSCDFKIASPSVTAFTKTLNES